MITTKGEVIDINGKTEWILFHRLSKKVNPVDFLSLTDSIMNFPGFLFTLSFLILSFTKLDLQVKFLVPASLCFCSQIILNLRVGTSLIKLLNMPLLVFQKFNMIIMAIVLIVVYFFLGWWTLAAIPVYLLTMVISIIILTSYQKRFYKLHWNKQVSFYEIFKNNSFLCAYKYYSDECRLPASISPTEEEIRNQDWLKPYSFMRAHWGEIESHFNKKARIYWRVYLQIDK
jgi:hypothetical protein